MAAGPLVASALLEPFAAPYVQRAAIAVLLLAPLAGAVGTHVVLRRLAFSAEVGSHAVFPGIVLAVGLGQPVVAGAALFALAAAALTGPLGSVRRVGEDPALAIVMTSTFAFGVVLVSRRHSYAADLNSFLLGRALTIDRGDLAVLAVTAVVVVGLMAALHKELVLRAFDLAATEAMGYRARALELVLDVAVAATVVAGLRTVGSALAVALVITPAATARLVTASVPATMAAATALTAAAGLIGLWASFEASVRADVRLAPGPAIVSVLTLSFAAVATATWLRGRRPGPGVPAGPGPVAPGEPGGPVGLVRAPDGELRLS